MCERVRIYACGSLRMYVRRMFVEKKVSSNLVCIRENELTLEVRRCLSDGHCVREFVKKRVRAFEG